MTDRETIENIKHRLGELLIQGAAERKELDELKQSLAYNITALTNADRRIAELMEGACRYNCRTAKENWLQGYIEAQHNAARNVSLDAIEAYNEVNNE